MFQSDFVAEPKWFLQVFPLKSSTAISHVGPFSSGLMVGDFGACDLSVVRAMMQAPRNSDTPSSSKLPTFKTCEVSQTNHSGSFLTFLWVCLYLYVNVVAAGVQQKKLLGRQQLLLEGSRSGLSHLSQRHFRSAARPSVGQKCEYHLGRYSNRKVHGLRKG